MSEKATVTMRISNAQRCNIQVTGILHVGAHKCEELVQYLQLGVSKSNIYWIEALQELVDEMQQLDGDTKIYQAVLRLGYPDS